MARKKNPEPPKIVELPKRTSKILSSDDYLELSKQAAEMALHAAQVEVLTIQADKARKFADELVDDFYTAYKLYEAQKEIFMATLKKFLG